MIKKILAFIQLIIYFLIWWVGCPFIFLWWILTIPIQLIKYGEIKTLINFSLKKEKRKK